MKIVLVDDLVHYTEALKGVFELDGHSVHTANDGATGLRVIREVRPDLAFIDLGLPDVDGYELARTIRAEGIQAYLVAFTARGGDKTRAKTSDAGFDRHILKPLLPDERREVLRLAAERALRAS